MKFRLLNCLAVVTLFAWFAIPVQLEAQEQTQSKKQPVHYTVTDLGPTTNFAEGINNKGWVSGGETLPDGVTQHAFLWREGTKTDLGTFGGPNSSAFNRPSQNKQVAVNAETSMADPLGEDFCLYGTHLVCLAFIWQNSVMTPLSTLGGNNSWANGGLNNRGQVVGVAENATLDPTCTTPGLEAKPVIWEKSTVQELPTFLGDEDGTALSINDRGQAVGASTDCNASPTIFHAVLWQNGTVVDLGSFGGALNNVAQGINNRGQVVGFSDLPGDTSSHAFLWSKSDGLRDLGTIEGLPTSLAFGINDDGEVVGMDCDVNFDCGAFLWQDGVMTDLNTLLPQSSPWNLIVATSINAREEIVGVGDTGNGWRSVLLTPCDEKHPGVEGCDYSMVDAETAAQAGSARVTSLPINARNSNSPMGPWGQFRGRLAHRSLAPAAGTPNEMTLSGTGTKVRLYPMTMSFLCDNHHPWSLCPPKPKTATLTNIGSTTLSISSITIWGLFSETNTCPKTLAAGHSCTITVTAHVGPVFDRGEVYVNDNGVGSPQTISLTFYEY